MYIRGEAFCKLGCNCASFNSLVGPGGRKHLDSAMVLRILSCSLGNFLTISVVAKIMDNDY